MDKFVQKINDKVSLIASKKTWIEGLAIQQLTKTAELHNMLKVAGMPDLHPGKGYPIGAAFFSENKIYPALVGNDIGCGMSLWQTSMKVAKVHLDKMTKKLINVEQPLDGSWDSYIESRKQEKDIRNGLFDKSLGTIGGGNHFAEFQAVTEIIDQATFDVLGLDKRQLQLLVHSGSRGLGQSILVDHVRRFNHDGIAESDGTLTEYMGLHDEAVRWAELNRELIAKRFLESIKSDGNCILDVNHNLVVAKDIGNTQGWLHRKGATPSDIGCVVILGSRGDYSYLVKPLTSPAPTEKALYSLAHGAGRKWKRGDCKARLIHKYKREDLYRTALGSRVICGDKELLYDEAPQAYKDCETIISDLIDADLITVVAKLIPLQNDIAHGKTIQSRAIIVQKKTGMPDQFEITENTRRSLCTLIEQSELCSNDYLFKSRIQSSEHISTRQYGRIVHKWVSIIGLDQTQYGTHSMRRTKPSLIYKKTKNLRACQLLLGHRKLESTVRYLGIEVDDALEVSEGIDS